MSVGDAADPIRNSLVIKLVMDNDNKSFIESCDWLVEQFHIVLIDDAPVKTNTDRTDKTDKNESVSSEQSVVEKKEISAISAISCVPSVARFCANFQILHMKNRTF
jgi:hypothetical protein